MFELDLETLLAGVQPGPLYEDVITYPPRAAGPRRRRRRGASPAGDLVAAAREAAGDELREVRVFDVYRGEQVGEGRSRSRSSLVFQSPERTLSDEDAAELRERIVAALAERFGAELRGGLKSDSARDA